MSTTIDQRVVEMRFDNKHFETNVATTMSTLDKLKKGLNLTGASKGLENINATASKINMSGLNNAVQIVQNKFSTLQIAAVASLTNIMNTAMATGKRVMDSLTVEPIKQGFDEYELKMGSVQTILASTGESLETVNKYLEELNAYSDQTIYSFSDMTANIGKFTNAGVKLEDAVLAIKGISNAAAVSGANSNEASRAMYNFSQALSAGYVKLIDWKSIENANMATVEFKQQLIDTAVALGTVEEAGDGMYKTLAGNTFNAIKGFNEVFQDEWMTSDVLITTLGNYADETTEIGKKATEAATKVKTFSQMMDTLKETAQSGWAQTWELVFGDFNEGTELWTKLGEIAGDYLGGKATKRNNTIREALNSPWDDLIEKVNEAGVETDIFQGKLDESLKEHGSSVEQLVEKYGSLEKAFQSGDISSGVLKNALDKIKGTMVDLSKITDTLKKGIDGEDVKQMQEALDSLGYDLGEPGVDGIFGDITENALKAFQNNHNLEPTGILDPETLEKIQYALSQTKTGVQNLSDSCDDLVESASKKSGRELLFDTLFNVIEAVKKPFGAFKQAWNNVFNDGDMNADVLYTLIEKLHDFTDSLVMSDDAAENFKAVCEGLLSAFKMLNMGISKGMTASFKLLTAVLKLFGTDLADIIVTISEYITKAAEWLDENTLWMGYIDKMADIIYHVISGIRYLVLEVRKLDSVNNVIERFKTLIKDLFGKDDGSEKQVDGLGAIDAFIKMIDNAFEKARLWIKTKDAAVQAGIDLVAGLAEGIKSGTLDPLTAIIELATALITKFKSMLGIASPSKVFIALGGFIISGLIIGLKGGLGEVGDTIVGIAKKIGDFFQGIDWSAVFVVGTIAAALLIFNKFVKVLDKFANPFDGLGDILSGFKSILESYADLNKAKITKLKSDALLNIAKSLVLMVGALVLLAYAIKKDWQSIAWGLGAITLLFGELFILAKLSEKMDPVAFGKLSLVMLAVGASLLLISAAIKKIASIDDTTKAWHAIIQISVIMGLLVMMMYAFGDLTNPKAAADIDKAGIMFAKIGVAIGVMALTIKLIATMSWTEIGKGMAVIGGVILLFGLTLAFFEDLKGYKGDMMTKSGSMFLKMAVAIGLMAVVIKLIATMSWGEIAKGLVVVGGIILLFGLTLWFFQDVSMFNGNVMTKSGSMFLKMAVAISLMALTIKLTASMSWGEIGKGLLVIGGCIVLFGLTLTLFENIGKKKGDLMTKAGSMLLKMSAAIGILVLAVRLLRSVSGGDILKCLGTVAAFEILFAGIIWVSQYAGKHAEKAGQMLLKMSLGILVLAGAIAILSLLDRKDVLVASAAIGSLILAFSALVASTKNVPKDCAASIITMIVVFALVAFAIGILSQLDVKGVLGSAAALSMVLLSLAGTLKIISSVKDISKDAYIALGAVMGALLIVAVILGVMAKFDIKPSLETAESLSILLLALAGVTLILSKVGGGAKAAIEGALAMDAVIIIIGGLLMGLGALVKYVPKAEEFLDKGIVVMQKIGEGMGALIGGFFGGIRNGFSDGLPEFAEDMSNFMENLQPFLDTASKIDPSVGEGVRTLAQAIITLTAANIWDSIASNVMGTSSLADFAKQLVPFGEAMADYAEAIDGINPEAITNSATAAKALAEFANNVPNMGGLAAIFAGENSLVTFGEELVSFGDTIKKYSDAIAGIDSNTVENSATAAKALAEFASNVPNTGGLAAIFAGENGITSFGWRLVQFGEYMSQYSEAIAGVNIDAVTKSATAGKALAELASAIPNAGGLIAIFSGENGMGMFGRQIVKFGKAMTDYSEAIAGVDSLAVISSAIAGAALVELAKTIPNTGGLMSWLTGENDMSSFAKKIVKFGEAMSDYSESISGIDISAVSTSANAAQALANLSNSLPKSGGLAAIFGGEQNITTFGLRLISFGKALASYSETAAGINTSAIYSSMSAVKTIANTLGNLQPIDQKTVSSLKSSINTLAQANVSGFMSTFNQTSSSMSAIGGNMAESIASGISANRSTLTNAANSLITSVSNTISSRTTMFLTTGRMLSMKLGAGFVMGSSTVISNVSSVVTKAMSKLYLYYGSFFSAGKYLVSGFAEGITANTWKAEARAKAMAKAAYEEAKEELDINSPSRLFMPLGSGVVEGFAKGISDNQYLATNATDDMANSTFRGLSRAMSGLQTFINSDMDVQPTIRPVLDLSDVKSGVGNMNDMLGASQSVGIMSNVKAINTMMNRNRQNGQNGDVVSAIDRLRKDMGNVGGTTNYNVNGVTYSNGSEVADAIGTLVRYAIIEGRS